MSGATRDEQRVRAHADALLERDYDALKPEVLRTVAGKLAARGVQLPQADLDAAYNQAWHGLHTKLSDGEQVENPTGLLVAITHRRALDEHRALHPDRRAGEQQLDALVREDDLDARLDDAMRLRQFVSGLRERLDRRELEAAALCYVYDYTRPEAARLIGVKPTRMEKIMDGVSKKLAPLLGEISAGAWCEQHSSLVKAYALGLLEEDGERHRLARDHLADCPSCRRSVLRVRGLAAVVPPLPVLALGVVGAAGAGAAGATSGAGSSGAAASAGHGGAGRHLLSDPRSRLVAGAVLSVLVVVVAALAATGLFRGGDDAPVPVPPVNAAPDTAQAARASRIARARARERVQASVRAEARARARARRIAAARRRAAAAPAPARTATTATAPAAAPPAPPPAPAASPPPPPPPPAAAPAPAAEPAPAPAAQPPARDGAEEFDLR